jgi:hypothetical protein
VWEFLVDLSEEAVSPRPTAIPVSPRVSTHVSPRADSRNSSPAITAPPTPRKSGTVDRRARWSVHFNSAKSHLEEIGTKPRPKRQTQASKRAHKPRLQRSNSSGTCATKSRRGLTRKALSQTQHTLQWRELLKAHSYTELNPS